MENRLGLCIVTVAIGVLALTGGCTRAEAPTTSSDARERVESTESTPVVYPTVIDSKEGTAPALTYKEYKVPGMGELEGYGERFATLKYPMQVAGKPTTLALLDFTTGTTKQVVSAAVGFDDGYNIVGVSGGDRWIAWEELNGEDGVAASGDPPTWKLYVAPIDVAALTCGTPTLVEEGELATRSRPLFRVDGDALYWMTNTVADGKPDSAGGAIVKVRDLASGTARTVCETERHYATMSVGDGKVVVAEQGNGSERTVVRVFDPASGEETWSLDLNNTEFISHFPQVHEGCVAWTLFAPGGLSYPDLFYRGTDGITHRVRNTASDPIPVGRYVFYDAIDVSGTGPTLKAERTVIGGYDPATNETFTIIGGGTELDEGWLMPMGRGYSPDTFVISNDRKPSTLPVEKYDTYPMRIRRYTVPAQ